VKRHWKHGYLAILVAAGASTMIGQTQPTQRPATRPAQEKVGRERPDHGGIQYGPHKRNVLDLWQAKSDRPTPLVIFIHGGGFRSGDRSGVSPAFIKACRDAGISVASISYRLSNEAAFPAFMHDGARAVQFLRHKAAEWNIDPKRIAATGGSAGAGISLWLAFHDDLAKPDSDDPVARQSTRLACAIGVNGQSSYDPRFFVEHGLAPAVEHPFIVPFYGIPRSEFDTPKAHKLFDEAAPITHVTKDDPPAMMIYSQKDTPLPPNATAKRSDPTGPNDMPPSDNMAGRAVHHPTFGTVLKKKMEALGIECVVRAGVQPATPEIHAEMIAFFRKHFENVKQ
jgi:acetyl esterase/lipase